MNSYFIVAPDTDQGKTYLTAGLFYISQLLHRDSIVMKPVQCGINNSVTNSPDLDFIYTFSDVEVNSDEKELLVPYLFKSPCSPHYASELENSKIKLNKISNSFKMLQDNYKTVFVESAGGILSPLSRKLTNIDLLKKLNLPIIIATDNSLGAISRTLSTIKILKSEKSEIKALFFVETKPSESDFEIELREENRMVIKDFYPEILTFSIPYFLDKESAKSFFKSKSEEIGTLLWSKVI